MKTIGDHIRKRRLGLHLLQRDVADRIGVSAASIWQWERNRSDPATRCLPAIIDFLGYLLAGSGTSFPEALRIARRTAGLTQEHLAKLARVDESSIAKRERGDTMPLPATVQRLSRFFKKIGRPLPELGAESFYDPGRRALSARKA